MKILEVEELCKRFPGRRDVELHALDSVTFSIDQGETFGLVGGSGSGKSTLAFCILRLLEPSSGGIRFKEQDWLALRGKELRCQRWIIQPVFQDPDSSLNPLFSIRQVIEEPMLVRGKAAGSERRDRVEWLVSRVGLEKELLDRLPGELSGGQRQRVAIARALAPEPELLIADEPVSSLDASTQSQIMELLTDLKKELGLTTLLISHDLALVAGFCDVVAVIYQGRILEIATQEEFFRNPIHPYSQALIEASRYERAELAPSDFEAERTDLQELLPGHWVAPVAGL